jgi:hypothetical protein
LIVCFNLRLIIFYLVENAIKPIYQSSFSSKKWSNCNVRTSIKQCLLLIHSYGNYKIARHWMCASFTLSYKVLTWFFLMWMNLNFPSSFTNFLISESEDILSQPSDSNQLIDNLTYSNLNVHTIKKITKK